MNDAHGKIFEMTGLGNVYEFTLGAGKVVSETFCSYVYKLLSYAIILFQKLHCLLCKICIFFPPTVLPVVLYYMIKNSAMCSSLGC